MRQAIRRLVPLATKFVLAEAPIVSALALRTFSASLASTNQVMISGFRSFRSTSFAASSLADALKSEIEYEKQNYTQPEVRSFSFSAQMLNKNEVILFHLHCPPPSCASINPSSFFLFPYLIRSSLVVLLPLSLSPKHVATLSCPFPANSATTKRSTSTSWSTTNQKRSHLKQRKAF